MLRFQDTHPSEGEIFIGCAGGVDSVAEFMYEERTKLFEQYADLTICEDGCQIEETIDAVLTQIEALEKK